MTELERIIFLSKIWLYIFKVLCCKNILEWIQMSQDGKIVTFFRIG